MSSLDYTLEAEEEGETPLTLPSLPQVLSPGSILLWKEEAWCHHKPMQR